MTPKKILKTERELRHLLREECRRAGSQRAWGEAHGDYKQNFLSEVIAGKKKIPDTIAQELGYERVVRYVRRAR